MSARAFVSPGSMSRASDSGHFGRLTWLGLAVVAIGWVALLGVSVQSGRVAPTLHADLVEIARCLIGSGFGLALVGALQTGFGALNRFFSAVLTRSSPRGVPATPVSVEVAPVPQVDRTAEPLRERRPYQILADGSVEVETIVGTRRFETMDEARDFI